MTRKVFLLFFVFLLASFGFASENRFEGFAVPYPIHDAVIFNDSLYLATATGIRQVASSGVSQVYTSEDGLETSDIVSLKSTSEFLYGVSRKGTVIRKKKNGVFQVVNRSYQEQGIQALPSVAVISNKILVIGFEKRLAFFSLETEEFIMSISKIGDVNLDANPLLALAVKEDYLFASVGQNIYSRKMDWENLKQDRLLADPSSWKKESIGFSAQSIAFDSLGKNHYRKSKGTFVWGKTLEHSAAEDSSTIVLGGKKLKDALLYNNGSSRVSWILPFNGKYFFVGSQFLGYGVSGKIKDYSKWEPYQLGAVYELTVIPGGGIIASGNDSRLSFIGPKGNVFSNPMNSNNAGWSNAFDGPSHLMKTLTVLQQGQTYYGLWGFGLTLFEKFDSPIAKTFVSPSGSCVENFLENYLVSPSAVEAPDGSGVLFSYWGKDAYGIGYLNLYGDVLCAPGVGSSSFSGPMIARKLEESSDFELIVSSGTSAALNGTGVLDKFVLELPSRSGFSLKVLEKETIKTPEHGFVLDMAFDNEKRLWAVTYTNVGFWESGDSLRTPHRISQFSGSAFSSIAIDPQGNPWIASNGQGVYHLKKKNTSVDTLFANRYFVQSGLLSNNVYDIALDSTSGSIWFAQDLGITKLSRNDLRQARDFMTDSAKAEVKVYPNPFRPGKHQSIIFDYVSEKSRISIFNAGGKLIQSFSDKDLEGGRLEWDAKDDSGNLVAPGVYHYIIKKGSKQKKGPLLIVN